MLGRRVSQALACLSIALGLGVVACKHDPQEKSTSTLPRNETLYVGGRQWGEPSTFNPLLGWMDWPAMAGVNLLYESLFYFNMLSGKLEPLLAQSYTQTDEAIEVVLNDGTHWNDGKPLT